MRCTLSANRHVEPACRAESRKICDVLAKVLAAWQPEPPPKLAAERAPPRLYVSPDGLLVTKLLTDLDRGGLMLS